MMATSKTTAAYGGKSGMLAMPPPQSLECGLRHSALPKSEFHSSLEELCSGTPRETRTPRNRNLNPARLPISPPGHVFPFRLYPHAGSGRATRFTRCTRAFRIQHIAPTVPSADLGRQVRGHTRNGAEAGTRTRLACLEGRSPTHGPHPQICTNALPSSYDSVGATSCK